MKITYLTLFPEMFDGVINSSIMKRSQSHNVTFNCVNFRDYSGNKHQQVDDYPYGGGQGMVLKVEPIYNALQSLPPNENRRVVLLCPQGKPFTQSDAKSLSECEDIVFICGHYEGYDERIREHLVTDEYSIGDYVLTGGELPAMVMTDAIVRLLPEVLGNELSHQQDSFSDGRLEHAQYTRPREFNGWSVPDILVSGDHAKIEAYRQQDSYARTEERRPDLL